LRVIPVSPLLPDPVGTMACRLRAPLPTVIVVDLRREEARPEAKGTPLYSRALVARLSETFAGGEQAILLVPRRGYAPFLLCRLCGNSFRCDACSVSRVVHRRERALLCHYCGRRRPIPRRCDLCEGEILEAVEPIRPVLDVRQRPRTHDAFPERAAHERRGIVACDCEHRPVTQAGAREPHERVPKELPHQWSART